MYVSDTFVFLSEQEIMYSELKQHRISTLCVSYECTIFWKSGIKKHIFKAIIFKEKNENTDGLFELRFSYTG
jgi:hypothetical protein